MAESLKDLYVSEHKYEKQSTLMHHKDDVTKSPEDLHEELDSLVFQDKYLNQDVSTEPFPVTNRQNKLSLSIRRSPTEALTQHNVSKVKDSSELGSLLTLQSEKQEPLMRNKLFTDSSIYTTDGRKKTCLEMLSSDDFGPPNI